jgi:hypothetical protein
LRPYLLPLLAVIAVAAAFPSGASSSTPACTPGWSFAFGTSESTIASAPSGTVICLGGISNTSPGTNSEDAVWKIPFNVTVTVDGDNAYAVCLCRFDTSAGGFFVKNVNGYPSEAQTIQAYFSSDSWANQPVSRAAENNNNPSLSTNWQNAIGTNTMNVLPANSDRRINVTAPLATHTDPEATYTALNAANTTNDSTDGGYNSAPCTGTNNWNPGSEPFKIIQGPSGDKFPFPSVNASDDDGSGTADTLLSYQTKQGGDENEVYYDGSRTDNHYWRQGQSWTFWETSGNGGAESPSPQSDTWSNLTVHEGIPTTGDPVQNACTGNNHVTGGQQTFGPEPAKGVGATSRGSGLGMVGNVVRGYEAYYGIHHPIGIELDNDACGHIYPANKDDGRDEVGQCTPITGPDPPYGLRLRLKDGWTLPTGVTEASLNLGQRNVLNAARKYGFILVDQGNQSAALSFSRRGIASSSSGEAKGDNGYLQDAFGPGGATPHRYDLSFDNTAGVPRLGLKVSDLRIVCTHDAVVAHAPGC